MHLLTRADAEELIAFARQKNINRLVIQTGSAFMLSDRPYMGLIGHTRAQSILGLATDHGEAMHKHDDNYEHPVGEEHAGITILHPLYFEISNFPRKTLKAEFVQELTPLQVSQNLYFHPDLEYLIPSDPNRAVKIAISYNPPVNYADIWQICESIYYLHCKQVQANGD